MSASDDHNAQTATANSGSVQRVVRRYVVTETVDQKRRPKLQTERRPLEEWEAEVLEVFGRSTAAKVRAAMLKAAGEIAIENLCASIKEHLPQSNVDGCRGELLEKLSERCERVGVTPNEKGQR